MSNIIVYTDGSCLGNPGPGGLGIVIVNPDGSKTEYSAPIPNTTNNRAELMAAIVGVFQIPEGETGEVVTDSQYVQKGISEWIHNWKRKGWKNASGQSVKNQDLWVELDSMSSKRSITWSWVKAHDKHPENERVDTLAQEAARSIK